MRSWGVMLMVIGGLGIVYPFFGFQLRILSFLDENGMLVASIALIAVGAVLTVLSFLLRKKPAQSTVQNQDNSGTGTQPQS